MNLSFRSKLQGAEHMNDIHFSKDHARRSSPAGPKMGAVRTAPYRAAPLALMVSLALGAAPVAQAQNAPATTLEEIIVTEIEELDLEGAKELARPRLPDQIC